MLESKVQKRITDYLDSIGVKWTKSITNTKSGDSDLTICYSGRYVACEVKAKGFKPTKLQNEKLWLVHQSGGLAFWADSLHCFKAHLVEVCSDNDISTYYNKPIKEKELRL